MAALELHDTDGPVLRENIYKAIDGLELPHQKVQQMLSDYMWLCKRSHCDDQLYFLQQVIRQFFVFSKHLVKSVKFVIKILINILMY